jgi:hypothetical protein
MKDQRIPFVRRTLEALLESLDATARLSRWASDDSAPELLRQSAALLGERLVAANRLASSHFAGSAYVVASLTGMTDAIKRLDAAYVLYRSEAGGADAAITLDAEIGSVRAQIHGAAP